MTAPHHHTDDVSWSNSRQLSLEEIDLLVRKCHHLHDEEIAKSVARLFKRIGEFFGYHHLDGHQHPAN